MKKFYIFLSLTLCALPLFYSCTPNSVSEDMSLYEYQQSQGDTGDDDGEMGSGSEETQDLNDPSDTPTP
ncbi:hypothetical protein NBRC110019_26600 [Neptunitalea chrysea]|uniref:Secreted protein n=1 Tax=Neptunitalea chrysea TaxID=1647581 RepID=A0A9W6B6I8_9FLAO|nr:hypothetical protein [Neptunitalea chrysea]GLB53619.1 hypothetical protein NBRC110019_26600 [Neptunitalea chrysea]